MKKNSSSLYKFLPSQTIKLVNRWKDFSPVTVTLMLRSSLALICILLVFQLTIMVSHQAFIQQYDEAILKWIETLRTPFMNAMMVDVTALGGLALTVILGTLAISLFILVKDPAAAIHLLLAAVGGFMISLWSKGLIARPRPEVIPQLIKASGFSYPSGHSITSAVVYVTMAILACRHFKSYKARLIIFTLAAIMVTLVSFSRLYLGVHYPSDTLSGAFMGIAWAFLLGALFSKTHFASRK
jgi:membrane-associated phospholipid phosphatase